MPKISVIMSAYNCEDYIRESIESVIYQTFKDWELIITDDCSSDNTPSIISEYKNVDKRIVFIKNIENRGLTENLAHMCVVAKGKYIARLDADDICRKDRLEKQITYIEKNNADFVCSYAQGIGNSKRVLKVVKHGEDLRANLLFFNSIVHSSVMFKKDESLNYDPAFAKSQDYELWDRMSANKKLFVIIPEALVCFRFHKNQISNRSSAEQAQNTDIIRKRAVERIVTNLSENAKYIFFNWMNKKNINCLEEYEVINNVFEQIIQGNNVVNLYDRTSLIKAIDNYRIDLVFYTRIESSEKIPFYEKIKVVLKSWSIQTLKKVIAYYTQR